MPPSTPTGLTISPLDGGGVHTTWSAYDVYRNAALLTLVYDTTSFDDTAGGTGDSYQVASVDAAGNTSPISGPVVTATV